jgi:hypothetical protein
VLWALVGRQHGLITKSQLLELGYSGYAIRHRLATGRLYLVQPGVYAVGRPALSQHGRWLAAVLTCGPQAVLSHEDAAALLGIRTMRAGHPVEVSVPIRFCPRRQGILVHRRAMLAPPEVTHHDGIPVTTPLVTLIDIAPGLGRDELEGAINEADKKDLTDPDELRSALDELKNRPGIVKLRQVLDRRTFTKTDSALERRFLPIA